MNDTTRRYPRTMSEAFADCRASSTEGWQRTSADQAVNWALFAGAVAFVFCIIFGVAA